MNYFKYNRDMKAWAGSAGINDQWCQNFVDWVFVTAFGLELAKKLIYTFTNYTPTGSNAFKKKDRYIKRGKGTPKRGDVIYFFNSSKGRIGHVGIVYKVTSSKVYTIEGNTSGASTLVTNGGGVKKKSYSLTSTYIDGYGSVDYSVITGDIGETPATLKLGDRELKNYTEGPDVKELQETLIPPAKKWLESHTTKNQQTVIWNVVKRLVEAAEQIITGEGKGDEKLAYVESWLKKYGYDIDRFVIEAAVKEMNDRQLTVVAEELEIPDDGCQGKDYCEIE